MRRRRLVILCVAGVWVVMMGTLVRRYVREVRPEFVPGTWPWLLTRERRNYQWRKGIYLPAGDQLRRIGHTQTVFYYRADGKYTVQNDTRVTVGVPGLMDQPTAFDLMVTALVDSQYNLERLTLRLDSEPVRALCHGVAKDGKLVLRAIVNDEEREPVEIDLPSGQIAAQGLSPLLAVPHPEVGMKWEVVVVNPFSFQPSRVEMEVRRRETLVWRGQEVETYVVTIRSGWAGATAWVTPDGEVLKEQTLFGLTFIREPLPEEQEGEE
jgi:hypothetical protein